MKTEKQLSGENISKFVLAGNAKVTIENPATGVRFTYKIRRRDNADGSKTPWFVSVLRGSDNTSDYSYIGFIKAGQFVWGGKKARAGKDAPSVRAFDWFFRHLDDPRPANVYHSGCCGRCGRELTVPESIETGLGPVCVNK